MTGVAQGYHLDLSIYAPYRGSMKKAAWACLILIGLPFAFFAFQDKPERPPTTVEANAPEISGKPSELVDGYLDLLQQTKEGVENLSETKPVRKVVEVVKDAGPVLTKILKRAFAVPETENESGDEGEPDEDESGAGCL